MKDKSKKIIVDDLEFIYLKLKDEFRTLSGSTILITGASGFFGKWLVNAISYSNHFYNTEIKLILITRSKTNLTDFLFYDKNKIKIFEFDICKKFIINDDYDYVIHMAAPTAHETFKGQSDLKKINTLSIGTQNLIDQIKSSKIKKFFFTSSGVVYGKKNSIINEESKININCLDTNGLAIGKLNAENLIINYSKINQIPFNICRCFSFIGPFLPLNIHYALGNFINDALNNDLIIIKGNGMALRSYLYIADTIVWLIKLLTSNESGIFNIGSDDEISIKDLAIKVREIISPLKKIVIENQDVNIGNFSRNSYIPSINKISKLIDVKKYTNLDDAISKTANFYM